MQQIILYYFHQTSSKAHSQGPLLFWFSEYSEKSLRKVTVEDVSRAKTNTNTYRKAF